MKKNISRMLIFIMMLMVPCFISSAIAGSVDSYTVRAMVLRNILSAVYWPESVLPDNNEPFVVCLLGKQSDKYSILLKKATSSLLVKGHRIEIRTLLVAANSVGYKNADFRNTLNSCHTLFVTADMHKSYRNIIANAGSQSILTVGEEEAFCRENGMVCLIVNKRQLDMVINTTSVRQAGLKISAEVLRHATLMK